MKGILADSWNLPVDGSLIQPGLRLSAYLRPEADTPGAAFHYFAGVFPDLGPAATAGLAPGGLGGQELNRSLVCFDRASTPDSEAFDNGGPTSLTHELGHLASLRHVGCGGAALPDPDYPNVRAQLGQWGLDLATNQPKDPTVYNDFMSYCSPIWISATASKPWSTPGCWTARPSRRPRRPDSRWWCPGRSGRALSPWIRS